MAEQIKPRATLTVDLTEKEYIRASLLAERRGGALRPMPLVVLLSAALLLVGLCSMSWFRVHYNTMILPLLFCVGCPVLLFFFFGMLPRFLKKQAARDYAARRALLGPVVIELYADYVVTTGAHLTLNDPYALMAGCIETPRLFVLLKDGGRMLVLPKRCLPEEGGEEITAFLRLVFARRRRVMQNWVF